RPPGGLAAQGAFSLIAELERGNSTANRRIEHPFRRSVAIGASGDEIQPEPPPDGGAFGVGAIGRIAREAVVFRTPDLHVPSPFACLRRKAQWLTGPWPRPMPRVSSIAA